MTKKAGSAAARGPVVAERQDDKERGVLDLLRSKMGHVLCLGVDAMVWAGDAIGEPVYPARRRPAIAVQRRRPAMPVRKREAAEVGPRNDTVAGGTPAAETADDRDVRPNQPQQPKDTIAGGPPAAETANDRDITFNQARQRKEEKKQAHSRLNRAVHATGRRLGGECEPRSLCLPHCADDAGDRYCCWSILGYRGRDGRGATDPLKGRARGTLTKVDLLRGWVFGPAYVM